jgi:hypothetical protein
MFSGARPSPSGGAKLTSVYVDQYTGAVVGAARPGIRRRRDHRGGSYRCTSGNFAGNGVHAVCLIRGLSPALLVVTA